MSRRGAKYMWRLAPLKLNQRRSPILDQSILLGRVLPGKTPYQLASGFNPSRLTTSDPMVEIRVPYFVYDDFLKTFFEHQWDFVALDTKNICKSGDTVLIERIEGARETSESLSLKAEAVKEFWKPDTEKKPKGVTHKIIECVHKLGDVQDPLTGKPVVVDRYRDEMAETARRYGLSESDFSYEDAPPRGWQEGTKDFTNRRTYKKWHQFKKEDKYGIVS